MRPFILTKPLIELFISFFAFFHTFILLFAYY
ncbi:hypothetical protein VSP9026_01280 [Vibrio spartinae]|uniref:Uncharacterized protein n=1 Tax=Vibrio spartinae TaxID=1918945 RepID=A0A1N6M2K1_9VIBR|nr:hypothetical protein VSP9026_01280 [Vibrio spartinae]